MSTKTYLSLIGLVTLITGSIVIVCLIFTNPLAIGPLGVTLWFLALFAFVGNLIAGGMILIKPRLFPTMTARKLILSSWRQGLLIGGEVTMLLALASLRQLGWRDVILLTGLVALVEVYFRARA